MAGYTIPAGGTIMVATSALQLNPDTFEDPLLFKLAEPILSVLGPQRNKKYILIIHFLLLT